MTQQAEEGRVPLLYEHTDPAPQDAAKERQLWISQQQQWVEDNFGREKYIRESKNWAKQYHAKKKARELKRKVLSMRGKVKENVRKMYETHLWKEEIRKADKLLFESKKKPKDYEKWASSKVGRNSMDDIINELKEEDKEMKENEKRLERERKRFSWNGDFTLGVKVEGEDNVKDLTKGFSLENEFEAHRSEEIKRIRAALEEQKGKGGPKKATSKHSLSGFSFGELGSDSVETREKKRRAIERESGGKYESGTNKEGKAFMSHGFHWGDNDWLDD